MQAPSGWALRKCVHAGLRSELYEGVRERDDRALLLKVYLDKDPAEAEARARREFEALRRVRGPGIVEAVEVVSLPERTALALARAPGISLADWVKLGLPEPEAFLEVAIQLADVLARVHAAHLLHRDLNPANVVVDPETLEVHVIDFELARSIGATLRADETRLGSSGVAGSLLFIAPEATGRMNRGVDSRSDLYSLGATLYFVLTGRVPFEEEDALALIHAHMARLPQAASELRPGLPPTLSRIASKLLQKTPEERYQTAHALRCDLEECRQQWRRARTIQSDFPLATADAPHRPLFPKRLYGREEESARLQHAYQSAVAGQPSLVLLSGDPGIGKSELVQELRVSLAETHGYLAMGKFDQYRPDSPYAGFSRAFAMLAQQILTESDARLAGWRGELAAALGAVAGALVALVPDLGFVLGEVPAIPKLGPEETRRRLALAIQKFLRAAATPEHPLLLCLDDLQWVDAASRELLRQILLQLSDECLLVVGIYRGEEVGPGHPLSVLLAELEQKRMRMQSIHLEALSEDASNRMLANALGRPREETRAFATIVARKTGNAPLLIQQFVYHLYDLRLIHFEPGRGWTWDEGAIAAATIPEGAVGLMTAKIGRLPESVAHVLKLASCTADVFDLDALAELSERPRDGLEAALFALCDEGLIAPAQQGFRFVHDRIREGAQALLSEDERARLHLQAAGFLLERTPASQLPERALEIADHFLVSPPPRDSAERLRRIRIHLLAGRCALQAGAPFTAARYLAAGREAFLESDWATHFSDGFDLFMQSAAAAHFMGEFDTAFQLLDEVDRQPLDRIQSAQVAARRIESMILDRRPELVPFILAALRRFGIRWPERPSRLRVAIELWHAERTLRGALDETTFPVPQPRDPHTFMAQLLLLAVSGSALAIHSRQLFALDMAALIRLYRREGRAPGLPVTLASWSALRLNATGDIPGAVRYASAALEWMDRMPDPAIRARTEYLLNAYTYPLARGRHGTFDTLRAVADRLFEVGQLEYGIYALTLRQSHMALAGENLDVLEREHRDLAARLRGARTTTGMLAGLDDVPLQIRILHLLREGGADDCRTADEPLAALEAELRHHLGLRFGLSPMWMMTLAVLGRFDWIEHHVRERVPDYGAFVVDALFFIGIAMAELAHGPQRRDRRRLRRRARACQRELERWARHNPEFSHMARGLAAENARLRGRAAEALAGYAEAAERAAGRRYVHHAALLRERRANLLIATVHRRGEGIAELKRAASVYEAWGATGKARALLRGSSELT